MNKAAGYFRCSSFESIDGDTWDRQRAAVQICSANLGYELAYEFREEAVPGKTEGDKRPAFQEMISTLLSNGCRTIIVESLDRLARAYAVQEHLITYIASKGLTLISANTGEDITAAMMGDPMKRALVQIQGILSELDKNMIEAKLRKARERIRKSGKRCEGRKPYGASEVEMPLLHTILHMGHTGMTAGDIADTLNQRGLKTRYGKPWNPGTVYRIIQRHQLTQENH